MLATEALLVIAFLLAILAAVGVRVALSLKDIGDALERIAQNVENREVTRSGTTASSAAFAPLASPAEESLTEETEIAAVIATAARYVSSFSSQDGPTDEAPASDSTVERTK